jgi:hypothetical protein
VAQVVECLPSKCEALSSNSSATKFTDGLKGLEMTTININMIKKIIQFNINIDQENYPI